MSSLKIYIFTSDDRRISEEQLIKNDKHAHQVTIRSLHLFNDFFLIIYSFGNIYTCHIFVLPVKRSQANCSQAVSSKVHLAVVS